MTNEPKAAWTCFCHEHGYSLLPVGVEQGLHDDS